MPTNGGQLWLNEINTLPGFTSQSMYPMLWLAQSGVDLDATGGTNWCRRRRDNGTVQNPAEGRAMGP
jgi:hypothetical protein